MVFEEGYVLYVDPKFRHNPLFIINNENQFGLLIPAGN